MSGGSVPSPPTNVMATALTSSSASVSFDTSSGATSYQVLDFNSGLSSPITVTGLTSGLSYSFAVAAINSAGMMSNYSSPSPPITLPLPTTPKSKGATTLITPAMAGTSVLNANAPSNTNSGDIVFISNTYPPGIYELATVTRTGSIYIHESLKNSYPANSSIYIYPPNNTLSEILADQNLPIPIADICFVKHSPIKTDQGIIAIQKINPFVHTINNKKIITITKSVTQDNFLICFEKDALGKNIPSTRTIVSKYHKIQNEHGKMIQAYKYLDYYENVKKIDYNDEILYNILMEDHETVNVNNLICETLHPEHEIAKLYKNNYSDEYTNTVIAFMNYSKKETTFRKG